MESTLLKGRKIKKKYCKKCLGRRKFGVRRNFRRSRKFWRGARRWLFWGQRAAADFWKIYPTSVFDFRDSLAFGFGNT